MQGPEFHQKKKKKKERKKKAARFLDPQRPGINPASLFIYCVALDTQFHLASKISLLIK
jgi:hypothetical protein